MNDADRAILAHFHVTRAKTADLAKRIAAQLLGRRADAEEHELSWLLWHPVDVWDNWLEHLLKDGRGGERVKVDLADRQSLLSAMDVSRRRVIDFFAANDGAHMGHTYTFKNDDGRPQHFVGRDAVLYHTDHESHHRAKIVLALRQWGHTDIPFLPYWVQDIEQSLTVIPR